MPQQYTSQVALQNTDLNYSITRVLVFASFRHNPVKGPTRYGHLVANEDDVMGRINSI